MMSDELHNDCGCGCGGSCEDTKLGAVDLSNFQLTNSARTALISAGTGVAAWSVARNFWPEYQTPILIAGGAAGTIAGELYNSYLNSKKDNEGMGSVWSWIGKVFSIDMKTDKESEMIRRVFLYTYAINDITFSNIGDEIFIQWQKDYGFSEAQNNPEDAFPHMKSAFESIIQDKIDNNQPLRWTDNTKIFLHPLLEEGIIHTNMIFDDELNDEQTIASILIGKGSEFNFSSDSQVDDSPFGYFKNQPVAASSMEAGMNPMVILAMIAAGGLLFTTTKQEDQ